MTEEALAVARDLYGEPNVAIESKLMTGSEDFAQFLSKVAGCFVFLGNGEHSPPLHNPTYDFNDDGLLHGAEFYAGIARRRLRPS
ncbi:metal-dependent amidase/aminoacylase/carboxypeptidase family protein [Rhizobium aethiopicum]|uniref:Metal-dependent amidase/aminoacylase/carboxypeptidase family protein n=1 Tax=Rhizobium aethiopicum TaxID=1138170 RepID=A0A7W6QBQ4_9HYPH|nr:metal-dependent amidase/aminoacylase/carboxypeptidase family protein [Rhizobium aethiopicum]MBB4581809.1 metal-dependent amidase/aminoacylase/carboxypeptidase family protein [Rhizobium aethiopicum]